MSSRSIILAALLGLLSTHARAGVFDKWLSKDSPDCIALDDIQKHEGVKVIKLNESQFQFARALYVAVPPVSHDFPPANSAMEVKADGEAMVILVADGKTCARFLAPDFIQKMLDQIEKESL
jgi:hypothetical protein